MRYILYARKSSESEDRQVQSIGDQLRVLREAAVKQGVLIVAELTESRSAKDPGTRPVFDDLLVSIERGEADGVLCWSINRLSRNPIDSGRLSWMLQKGTLKSIRTIDREYKPEDNVLLMAVESGVANQFVLDLSKAVIRGMEGKAARGWYPGKPPQGYKINPETREIEPREPQFSLLRRAWELLFTGSYTVPQIWQQLRSWGYTTDRRGGDPRMLAESSLYRVFDNPFYFGVFKFRDRVLQGKHRPMVTSEEFDRAQRVIHGETHIRPKRHEFPFTGLIRCGYCGCLVTAERKVKHYKGTGRTVVYEYYHCTRRRGPCPEPSVTGQFVESALAAKIRRISIHPAFGNWLLEVIDRDMSEQESVDQAIEGRQSEGYRAAETRLAKLIELRISDEITADEFASLRSQYERDLSVKRLEAEKTRVRHRVLRNAIRFGMTASDQFLQDDLKLKRQVVSSFVSACVLTQGNLRIDPHPLLARLATLEPSLAGLHQVRRGATHPKIPIQQAWRERIGTLLAEVCQLQAEDLARFVSDDSLESVWEAA